MEVKLISYTPDPELLCAAAARLCYSDISAIDILNNLKPDEIEHLLDIIISSGHHSVIEHIAFTFAIDGVSRVLTHQLVRHRVGIAFSQQSQRYASIDNSGYITPRTVAVNVALKKEYDELMSQCFSFYKKLQEHNVPKEDARFVLPEATATRLVMTVNMRQLIHMYNINACFRSQWEFRQLMYKIKQEVRKVTPRLARELKIKCFAMGYCDEATMCKELEGKMPRKEDVFEGYEQYTQQFYEDLAAQVGET